ncbi:putative vesicle-associated membrane protein 7A [Blattamonas nauphoetae]|uniref:Vesicle-associated membrane protein 7A n=1 Tax=Blattamonas nauphoetae TaxID=2049346 RepID=A0ABQ9YFB0_9EUKA|nr:putative vesicle-associated membrane protein 7A [Blattamonas nauphoetae]
MALCYTFIGSGSNCFVDASTKPGNFPIVSRKLMIKSPNAEGKQSYTYDLFAFHFIVSGPLFILCVSDRGFDRRVAFAMIQRIQKEFQEKFGFFTPQTDTRTFTPFKSRLYELMEEYSNETHDHLKEMHREMRGARISMEEPIDYILSRQERIDLQLDRKVDLVEREPLIRATVDKQSKPFYKSAIFWLCVLATLLVILIIVIICLCGGFSFKYCI